MNDNIQVSVLCTAYNHEKYIAKAIESFVNQKTNFKYEILINDDCSIDDTAKIIKEYENKYSNIRAIYQKENQYSKGVRMTLDILIPKAKGKYLAICEGDDYWIDEYKLQKQFEFMEMNKEYSLCMHNFIRVNDGGKLIDRCQVAKHSKNIECEKFIINYASFFATNSMFISTEYLKKIPEYFNILCSDYVLGIYLSSQGKVYCLDDYMSAYRVESENSWNQRMKKHPEKWIEYNLKIIDVLQIFNKDTKYKYTKTVEKAIIKRKFYIYVRKSEFDKLREEPYKSFRKKLQLKNRIILLLNERFPKFINLIEKIKKK